MFLPFTLIEKLPPVVVCIFSVMSVEWDEPHPYTSVPVARSIFYTYITPPIICFTVLTMHNLSRITQLFYCRIEITGSHARPPDLMWPSVWPISIAYFPLFFFYSTADAKRCSLTFLLDTRICFNCFYDTLLFVIYLRYNILKDYMTRHLYKLVVAEIFSGNYIFVKIF